MFFFSTPVSLDEKKPTPFLAPEGLHISDLRYRSFLASDGTFGHLKPFTPLASRCLDQIATSTPTVQFSALSKKIVLSNLLEGATPFGCYVLVHKFPSLIFPFQVPLCLISLMPSLGTFLHFSAEDAARMGKIWNDRLALRNRDMLFLFD